MDSEHGCMVSRKHKIWLQDLCKVQGWQRVLIVLICTASIFKMYWFKKVYWFVLPVYSMCTDFSLCTDFFYTFFGIFSRSFLCVIEIFSRYAQYLFFLIIKRNLMSFDYDVIYLNTNIRIMMMRTRNTVL